MRDSPFDMTAAGRSRSFVPRALLVALVLVAGGVWGRAGSAGAQTTTVPVAGTVPAATSAAPSATSAGASAATAATAGDEASTRTVNRIVFVLLAFGVVLVGVAFWFWRATKPLPRHLDGLDVMATRKWRDAGAGERSKLLAPVHERRAETGDEDLEVGAEPAPVGVAAVAESVPVGVDSPGAEADADTDAEETPRAS